MTSTQAPTITAEFEQTTKGGKRRYRIEGGTITGTIYVAPDDPRAEHDKLAVELKPAV